MRFIPPRAPSTAISIKAIIQSPSSIPAPSSSSLANKKHTDYVPAGIKVGRCYDDFCAFMEEHHLESCTEMDTVIGRPGGKVILTMIFQKLQLHVRLAAGEQDGC